MNKDIAKVTGHPVNTSEGNHTRSDNEASKAPKTRSLGEDYFLPCTARLGYGSEGVAVTDKGRSGPTGRT